MKTITLRRGDQFSHAGEKYRVNKSIQVKATAEHKTDTLVPPTIPPVVQAIPPAIPEVQGESKSDSAQGIPKAVVLEFIQEKINVLEKHENKLLMEGMFDELDDLDLVDQQRGEQYKTANYAATTVHIMDLKSLYNKVKKLS